MGYTNNYQNMLETNPEALIKELYELRLKTVDTAVKYKNDEVTVDDTDVFNCMLLKRKLIKLDLSRILKDKAYLIDSIKENINLCESELEKLLITIQSNENDKGLLDDMDEIVELSYG